MNRIYKLTAKQEKLIGYLLSERTIDQACGKAGVGVATYGRWLRQEAFVRAYRKARRDILEGVVSRLQGLTVAAVDALERNLNCENPAVEIRSASMILEQAVKGVEMLDLEARIETLEDTIKAEYEWNEQSFETR